MLYESFPRKTNDDIYISIDIIDITYFLKVHTHFAPEF